MKKIIYALLLIAITTIIVMNYKTVPEYIPDRDYIDLENEILEAFILAKDSSTIKLPEGHFLFSQSLSLDDKKHLTIKGEGMDKTVLSFKGQQQGAEGIKITNSQNIILEDFSIEDAAGDNLKVKKGTITGIIGPNGSGKTTLFNLIAGNLKSSAGNVLFNNENITDVPSYELFSKGLLRTFQIAHEFTNLSVLENLMMVPGNQSGEKLMNALLKPSLVAKEEEQIKEKAMEVVDFLNLSHLKNELAGNLSGGQKKLLELGRTMMVDAKLVLLDEVGAGVNRTLLKDLGTAIEKLNKEKGYTFCMIEHDMDFIGRLCDPVIVMAEGSVLFEGSVEDAKKDENVIESYLGRGSKLKDN